MESMQKQTKIVCTIGPSSSTLPVLKEMIASGMNIARINFSHGDKEANLELTEKVRQAAIEAGAQVAILQDLQGPKIRVGTLPEAGLELLEGKLVRLKSGVQTADPGVIPVPYERFARDLGKSDRILVADGTRELEVVDVQGDIITAKVLLGGTVISHKGINVPTVTLSVESMTEKDDEDLAFGLKQNIDFVALSFVRSAEDVQALKDKITKWLPEGVEPPQVIVKIEKHEALKNFDEILQETDGVMIARGDLGLETPVTKLPIRQKELIAKCVVAGKPVITATEMMASMEYNPRPTRAEVSDVANAVIDHTDAVMLSGESAMGKYPVQVVKTMAEIIHDTEESPLDELLPHKDTTGEPVPSAVAAAAVELSRHIGVAAIVVTTTSGYSARQVARFRPNLPIFAATHSPRVCRQLLLTWGVIPFLVEEGTPEKMAEEVISRVRSAYDLAPESKIVVMSGLASAQGAGYDSVIRVRTV